jgi:hypothetical protein
MHRCRGKGGEAAIRKKVIESVGSIWRAAGAAAAKEGRERADRAAPNVQRDR